MTDWNEAEARHIHIMGALERMDEVTDDESLARLVAKTMGDSSAAAAAIADLERRRADGILAWIEFDGRTWWVRGSSVSATGDDHV